MQPNSQEEAPTSVKVPSIEPHTNNFFLLMPLFLHHPKNLSTDRFLFPSFPLPSIHPPLNFTCELFQFHSHKAHSLQARLERVSSN